MARVVFRQIYLGTQKCLVFKFSRIAALLTLPFVHLPLPVRGSGRIPVREQYSRGREQSGKWRRNGSSIRVDITVKWLAGSAHEAREAIPVPLRVCQSRHHESTLTSRLK